ncbi:hypothetical protein PHSY_003437 [Pseudozyma hubeiensis SY62]|uniref:Uncharacterized protein n=1 Tax=Pseudozyma hubeiensis (strain SY62) TaxID=1305764 RepID=R9PCT0_PSEHS|nr:hypothetical protein PHSY_003437 [Pseudozyma hubeiensis SY62]GAC95860.1 hypothetical protein PHSY_003437 [Pseudozyma hubeiensis SY62]
MNDFALRCSYRSFPGQKEEAKNANNRFLQQHTLRYRSPYLYGLSLSLYSDPAPLVYEAAQPPPPADSTI